MCADEGKIYDVVIVGGGPAGLAAAIAAAEAGSSVILVEHEHRLGGHLVWGSDEDRAVVADLVARAEAAGVEILTDSTVTGRYEDNWVAIAQRNHPGVTERLIKARAKTLVDLVAQSAFYFVDDEELDWDEGA